MLSHLGLALPIVLLGAVAAPPPSPAALDALVAQLGRADAEHRLAAAGAIARLPATGLALYVERLARPLGVPYAALAGLLLEVGAQIPNPDYPAKGELWLRPPAPPLPRVRRGEPRPRRLPPPDPEQVDWLTTLARLDLEATPALRALPERERARAVLLEAVAWMRALSASQRMEAAAPLFAAAFVERGILRDEAGRALRALGSYAIPTLVRHAYDISRSQRRQRRYAAYQLDRMDRARPSRAIASAPNDAVRSEIIKAYGEMHAIDAVEPILRQVDSTSNRVRQQARLAWLGYVVGPPPPPAPMRKRKLPGGKEEDEAKEDYLNYRELAALAVARQLEELAGDQEAPQGSAEEMTRALFARYDARRAAGWETVFAAAMSKRAGGDLAGAIADFSRILARDPLYQRRGEMASAYAELAERRRQEGQADEAMALFGQAAALASQAEASGEAARCAAMADLIAGEQAATPAGERRRLLERARRLDPSLTAGAEALARLQAADSHLRRARQIVFVGTVLVAGSLVATLGHIAARRRRQRQSVPPLD